MELTTLTPKSSSSFSISDKQIHTFWGYFSFTLGLLKTFFTSVVLPTPPIPTMPIAVNPIFSLRSISSTLLTCSSNPMILVTSLTSEDVCRAMSKLVDSTPNTVCFSCSPSCENFLNSVMTLINRLLVFLRNMFS
ncbi:hypothetical protein ACB094_05G098000 [Castanea mollissima]